MSESTDKSLRVLSDTWMIGGRSDENGLWEAPLRNLSRAIAAANVTGELASSPLKVQVRFLVTGPIWQPDFDGVRTGGYGRKENCLVVEIALEEEPPFEPGEALSRSLLSSIDVAEKWFVRKKLGTDLRELRAAVNAIAQGAPLDSLGIERREVMGTEPDNTPLEDDEAFPSGTPNRFRIVPDDYHVPFAGTAQDGRRFFLSNELFGQRPDSASASSFVATFFWNADGSFESVDISEVDRPAGIPSAQAVAAGPEDVTNRMLLNLGDFTLEPIEVAPFSIDVDGVTFGFVPEEIDEDEVSIQIAPGNFIAYYEPWDGEDYDT